MCRRVTVYSNQIKPTFPERPINNHAPCPFLPVYCPTGRAIIISCIPCIQAPSCHPRAFGICCSNAQLHSIPVLPQAGHHHACATAYRQQKLQCSWGQVPSPCLCTLHAIVKKHSTHGQEPFDSYQLLTLHFPFSPCCR